LKTREKHMTVRDLKEALEHAADEQEVKICIETPSGWVCPDGCVVNVKYVAPRGIDWHARETLLYPEFELKMTESAFKEWTGKKTR